MFRDGILVLDFGGSEARAVARKLRGEQVYCEIQPFDAPVRQDGSIRGLILAGGKGDPAQQGAPQLSDEAFSLNLPTLGFGYGALVLMKRMGARRVSSRGVDQAAPVEFLKTALFEGLTGSERAMERLEEFELPEGVRVIASVDGRGVGFANVQETLFALQFYPEANDPDGLLLLRNFASICRLETDWTVDAFLEQSIRQIRDKVGEGRALIAISGGVDSSVCAALMHRAIGCQLVCLHVDTGLMRKGERELVQKYFTELGVPLRVIDARERFLEKLRGQVSGEGKSRAVFEEYEQVLREAAAEEGRVDHLVEGTIYTDRLDNLSTHNGLGGSDRVEPIDMLFKEEVRDIGRALGLPEELVNRQAFPSAGLALRCMGEVTSLRLAMVRDADQIFREEIQKAGLEKRVRQYFCVLTGDQTGGAGDPTGYTVALRAVNPGPEGRTAIFRLPYDLLERIVERITSEVPGVNRVVYDVTGQPPASIEWC